MVFILDPILFSPSSLRSFDKISINSHCLTSFFFDEKTLNSNSILFYGPSLLWAELLWAENYRNPRENIPHPLRSHFSN